MKAQIITIGDEILIGQITDTNSTWLGEQLTEMGIEVISSISIQDKKENIVDTIKMAIEKVDLVILTGGLGPTKDDVTKAALAQYTGAEMYFDEQLYTNITSYFSKVGFTLTDAHKRQCYMPEGVELLINKMGTAPGMLLTRNNKHILSLPGVPHEMKWIFEHSFKDKYIRHISNSISIEHRTIRTIGMGETRIEKRIGHIIEKFPKEIKVAYLPGLGQVKIRLTAMSKSNLTMQLEKYVHEIAEELGDLVFGHGKTTIEEALRDIFIRSGKSLSTAESCTGGLIANRITAVPDSSKYYYGSIVAYNNNIKESLLYVRNTTLIEHGAVSEETVKEMLNGLLLQTHSDIGIAVSGVAGPGGGTPEKPVGTVWMAWGSKEKQFTEKLQLGKDRTKNIEYTTVISMNRLRLFLTQ